jgi:hypothetical protein
MPVAAKLAKEAADCAAFATLLPADWSKMACQGWTSTGMGFSLMVLELKRANLH